MSIEEVLKKFRARRGGPITHDQADAAAMRLIHSHFNQKDGARISIPADPFDDDILIRDYIAEQRERS